MDALSVNSCYYSRLLYGWADRNFNIYTALTVRVKQSLHRPVTGPEGSRMLRIPDFKAVDT